MTPPALLEVTEAVRSGMVDVALKVASLLLSPGSQVSLLSLTIAFGLAVMFLRRRPGGRKRELKTKLVVRALFPRKMIRSASTRTDLGYFVFSVFLVGALFGWSTLSHEVVGKSTAALLTDLFGARAPLDLSGWAVSALLSVALFLAYELAFWIDHWISHNVPFFWEAHKVHHTAEVLTPLTNFRMHPIDTVKFVNVVALFMGTTSGVFGYAVGGAVEPIMVAGVNVIVLAFTLSISHLLHSQLWIPFTGTWGRVFISPAHHQIHHSTNPADFGKNLGAFLAIWDWAFGTLRLPSARKEPIVVGVAPVSARQHTVMGSLLEPFWLTLGHLWSPIRRLRRASPAEHRGQLDVRRPQELVDG